jgi:hypothetical protein
MLLSVAAASTIHLGSQGAPVDLAPCTLSPRIFIFTTRIGRRLQVVLMAALRSTRRLAGALAINAWLPQAIARSRLRDRCVRPQSTLREAFSSSLPHQLRAGQAMPAVPSHLAAAVRRAERRRGAAGRSTAWTSQ